MMSFRSLHPQYRAHGNPVRSKSSLSIADEDPYWSNVTALLHFDGADGSTSIVDETGKTWTASGGAALDTAMSAFGPSSGNWTGSTPQIACAGVGVLDMANDFTIEYWVNQATAGTWLRVHAHFYNSSGTAEGLNIYRHATTGMLHVDNGVAAATPGTAAIPLGSGAWVAVCRDGGTIRAYVNGVQCLANPMQSYPSTINLSSIGLYRGGFYAFDGNIDEFRVTNGVCRYPGGATFTPPTAPFPDS